jgi:DNA-binding NtrC family response regulator
VVRRAPINLVRCAPALVYRAPVNRALLTWSDAGTEGPSPSHHGKRPSSDRGPVLRLLEQDESRYDAVVVLAIPAGETPAKRLVSAIATSTPRAELRLVAVGDPSDHGQLFRALAPVVKELKRLFPPGEWALDVLLSAGTPQAQTIFVILVQAGILPARLLQVIPAAFVPDPHPRAIREVRLDIEGFPEIRALRAEVVRLRAEVRARAPSLVGESEPMRRLATRLARVAATDVPALILGETGTGKELVARAIHDGSDRARGPFIAESCGVFAEGVVASELFGHEAGAFTGASARRRGLFEQAHGGTLLLDEVGELAPRVQTALLRVLQEGALRRVGGEARIDVDVRILAATHRDLAAMVAEGTFREDLYYRLRGATIQVPPLRERPSDLDALIATFLDEARPKKGARRLEITRQARQALAAYAWPGNVRELRAEVRRWAVFCEGTIDVDDLAEEIVRGPRASAGIAIHPGKPGGSAIDEGPRATLEAAVRAAEIAAIGAALHAREGNLSRTARALGIDRNTLKRKLALFDLRPGELSPRAPDPPSPRRR